MHTVHVHLYPLVLMGLLDCTGVCIDPCTAQAMQNYKYRLRVAEFISIGYA